VSHRRRRRSLQVAGCPAWSSSTSTQSQATCREADYTSKWNGFKLSVDTSAQERSQNNCKLSATENVVSACEARCAGPMRLRQPWIWRFKRARVRSHFACLLRFEFQARLESEPSTLL
jgi:hypothetical protein